MISCKHERSGEVMVVTDLFFCKDAWGLMIVIYIF